MNARKILILIVVFALSFGLIRIAKKYLAEIEPKKTIMSLAYDTYDFQKLERFSPAQTYFYLTNAGEHPLEINRIVSTCGCTVPDWQKTAIPPGGMDSILVTFDASEQGLFHRDVIVYSNSISSPDVLYIKGEVQAKDE
jgi:hypothetical protein